MLSDDATLLALAQQFLAADNFEMAFRIVRLALGNSKCRFPCYQVALKALVGATKMGVGLSTSLEDVHLQPTLFPREIFQFWDSPLPPQEVISASTGWSDMNTEFNCIMFNEEQGRCIIVDNFGAEIGRQYDRCFHPAMKSDFFRLCYGFKFGGVYIDADEACIVPLRSWLPKEPELIVSYATDTNNTYVHNWFFAACPAHPVMERGIILALEKLWAWEAGSIKPYLWDATGPGNLTRAIIDTICTELDPFPAAPRIRLITERELRRYMRVPPMPYKETAANWRKG